MKKHSFDAHLQSVRNVFWKSHGSAGDEERRWMWFTAYERWLNDRPLMADEDPDEKP